MIKASTWKKTDCADYADGDADWPDWSIPEDGSRPCQARVMSANFLSSQIRPSDLDNFINGQFLAL